MWAERIRESDLAEQLMASGSATGADLHHIAEGWRRWAASEDGWFAVPHGEILCRA